MAESWDTISAVNKTCEAYHRKNTWEKASQTYPRFYMAEKFLKQNNRTDITGTGVKFNVRTSFHNTASIRKPYQPDEVTTGGEVDQGEINPIEISAYWAWWEEELAMNGSSEGADTLIDLLAMRYDDQNQSLLEFLEVLGMEGREGPDDYDALNGIFQYLPAPTSTTAGFQILNPPNFDDTVGLDRTADPNLRPYGALYQAITDGDLLEKMRLGRFECDWFDYRVGDSKKPDMPGGLEYLTTIQVVMAFERLARANNDNMAGAEIQKFANQTTFMGTPMTPNHYLSKNCASHPIIGLDWSGICIYFWKNFKNKKTGPVHPASQHNGWAFFDDSMMNILFQKWRSMMRFDRV